MVEEIIEKGDMIEWCDEYYFVLEANSQNSGKVTDIDGNITNRFYFNFQGEKSKIILKNSIIKRLIDEGYFISEKQKNIKKALEYLSNKRYTDKKQHDAVLWCDVKKIINKFKD